MGWGGGGEGGGELKYASLQLHYLKRWCQLALKKNCKIVFPAENWGGGGTPPPPLTAPSHPPKPADGGIGVCLCSCEVNYFVL